MRCKIFFFLLIISLSSAHLFAQKNGKKSRRAKPKIAKKVEQENSRIKNFGKSLVQNPAVEKVTSISHGEDDELIKVETNLVIVDVLVVDGQGEMVKGLQKDDFLISEDRVGQEIGTFSLGNSLDIPRSIVLIVDYSGSQVPFLKTSLEAAKVLVDKLNPQDKMAIVTDDVELIVDFTGDKQLLKRKLDSIYNRVKNGYFVETEFVNGKLGESLQYNSLLASLNELFSRRFVRLFSN